jgi:hypothetical protein
VLSRYLFLAQLVVQFPFFIVFCYSPTLDKPLSNFGVFLTIFPPPPGSGSSPGMTIIRATPPESLASRPSHRRLFVRGYRRTSSPVDVTFIRVPSPHGPSSARVFSTAHVLQYLRHSVHVMRHVTRQSCALPPSLRPTGFFLFYGASAPFYDGRPDYFFGLSRFSVSFTLGF